MFPTRRLLHARGPRLFALIAFALAPFTIPSAQAEVRGATEWAGSRPFDATSSVARALDDAALRSASGAPRTVLAGADGEWQRIAPPRGIHRLQPAMIYDPVRNRMVAFGGSDRDPATYDLVYTNTVSVLQLPSGNWVPLATAGTPPAARRLHRAIYDPSGDRMIVYGGWNDALLDDVWQLTLSGTPTWSQLSPSGGGPGARAGAGVAYDSNGLRMLVFGGFDGVSAPAGRASDVWALSLTGSPEWSLVADAGAGPPGRSSVSAAFDPSGPALVVFGGTDTDFSNEVWKLALSGTPTWSLVSANGTAPAPREEQAAVFDPASHRLALFGGYDALHVFGDLEILDFSDATPAWSNPHPLPCISRRWGAGAALDDQGRFFVYGGRTSYGGILGDFWKVPVAAPSTWTTFEQLLPPRLQEVMVLDTNRDRLVVFGGTDGSYRNDTYTHSMVLGTGWEPLATAGTPPPARRLHTGVYDPVGDRLIVFAGYDDHVLGDLWQLTFAGTPTWSPLVATGGGPSPRGGHVAIYDPEGRRMIVFGGYDGVTPPANRVGDTWELSLTGSPAWTLLDTGPGPSARSSATAVYDAAHHGMIVFGGTDPSYRNDAWRLSLDSPPSWSLIDAGTPAPGAREEQSAAYDSRRDRMVVFGGYDSSLQNYGDLWSLGLESPAWSTMSPSELGPSPRWGMKALYDASRDGMWLYGGWSSTYQRDLWMLQWFPDPVHVATVGGTSSAEIGVAHLGWSVPKGLAGPALVERSADGASWTAIGSALPSRDGRIAFDDRTAPANQALAWRARAQEAGTGWVSDALWMTVPGPTTSVPPAAAPAFALRLAGRASAPGAVAVECSLPRADRATLELLDVSGRVLDRVVLAGRAGDQRVEIGRGLKAGLFFARLSSGNERAALKITHLD